MGESSPGHSEPLYSAEHGLRQRWGRAVLAFGLAVAQPSASALAQDTAPTQPRSQACGVLRIAEDQRITLPANARVATRINFPGESHHS